MISVRIKKSLLNFMSKTHPQNPRQKAHLRLRIPKEGLFKVPFLVREGTRVSFSYVVIGFIKFFISSMIRIYLQFLRHVEDHTKRKRQLWPFIQGEVKLVVATRLIAWLHLNLLALAG